MKAIRYYGPEDVRLDDIPEPIPGPGQVKVKVAWCGICGTDLHTYQGHTMAGLTPTATEPHHSTGDTLPIVLGHEFSGTIVELGPGVDASKYAVGQKVAVEPLATCRAPDCAPCNSRDDRIYCPRSWAVGMSSSVSGGLAEYVVVDQELAHILPQNASLEDGALIEPFAVAWRGAKRGNIKAGDRVLIVGAGPIAILMIHVARLFGATWIAVSGRRPLRCELAKQHGASVVYDATQDVAAETLKATDGRGADVVIDCAGTQSSIDTSIKAVRPTGTILNLATWEGPISMDMNLLLIKQVNIANSLGYSNDHPELLEALGKGMFGDLSGLITQRVSLEDFVEKGIKALQNEKDRHVKILIHP